MDVSVIIVNYNVRAFLNSALISLFKSLEGLDAEIFVVDNASDDGSVELIKTNFPSVHLIANSANVGFAKANNQAMALAKGKYLLLINPDTLVQEDSITTLIKYFEEHSDAGMVGCKILNPDGTLQLACRRSFPTPWVAFTKTFGLSAFFPRSKKFAQYNLTYRNPDETYEVDAISGSFMMMSREVYEKIGGLDETFFMYGEDLDWCYRVQQAGWKVFYVPTTSIIHYKGESTRRSDLDELKVFYNAMRLFVQKHHSGSPVFEWFIYSGIYIRKFFANLARIIKPLMIVLFDVVIVNSTILIAKYIRTEHILGFPHYAYPWIFIVPAFIVFSSLLFGGVYTKRKLSVSRSFVAVLTSYIIISSLTAFIKDFAFSRVIVLISGGLSLCLLPGWRLLMWMFGVGEKSSRATLFGKRTLIVGVNDSGKEVVKKLRARVGGGYSIVGFVDVNRQHIGEKILDIEILGSIDTITKLIEEEKISEVIFSSDSIPYSTILKIIANNRNRFVNFRLVPNSLEVIIGKSSIDQLDEIPFIDIEYAIAKLENRILKRIVDFCVSLCFLIFVAPFVYFSRIFASKPAVGFTKAILNMHKVLVGSMSLVGYRENGNPKQNGISIFWGKPGIISLINAQEAKKLNSEECEQYELYYAKNQSFLLDIEIFVKSLQRRIRR